MRCNLSYFADFYPETPIYIADGSVAEVQQQNKETCSSYSRSLPNLRYLSYDYEFPLIDRIEDALSQITEEYVLVSADDDFPIMEGFDSSVDYLRENPSFVVCGGRSIFMKMSADGQIITRPLAGASIQSTKMVQRFQAYARRTFPTYYCVARRTYIEARIRFIRDYVLIGFSDFVMGLHDLSVGNIKILNQLTYIRTANSIHSYTRSSDRLTFLKGANRLLGVHKEFASRLTLTGEVEEKVASRISEDLLLGRIAYVMGVEGAKKTAATIDEDPIERKYYDELLNEKSITYQRYSEKIEAVKQLLSTIAKSDDNAGESRFQTIE